MSEQLLIFSIVASFFSSTIEASFLSLDRVKINRLEHSQWIFGRIGYYLVQRVKRVLVSILLINLISNIFSMWFLMLYLEHSYSHWVDINNPYHNIGIILSYTVFIIIFVEIIPKQVGLQYNKTIILLLGPIIMIIYFLLFPIAWLYSSFFEWIIGKIKKKESTFEDEMNKQEFLQYTNMSLRSGALSELESVMIRNFITYRDLPIRNIMLPRVNVIAIDLEISTKNITKEIQQFPYNNLIFYKGAMDHIEGYISKKDLYFKNKKEVPLDTKSILSYIHKAKFALESLSVMEIFEKMYQEKIDTIFVVDELGSLQGMVTYRNIINKVLGRISHTEIEKEGSIQYLGKDYFLINAQVPLIEFNQYFKVDIHHEFAETIGGYLLEQFKNIPKEGDVYEDSLFLFHIKKVDNKSIQEILIIKKKEVL